MDRSLLRQYLVYATWLVNVDQIKRLLEKYQLTIFFVVAFAISWYPWYTGGHGIRTWGGIRGRPDRRRYGERLARHQFNAPAPGQGAGGAARPRVLIRSASEQLDPSCARVNAGVA